VCPPRRRNRRRSSATWSLRLRPVCSFAPAAPASSVTRRSTAVWMSSSVGANMNVPSPSSSATVSSAVVTASASSSVSKPTRASSATWAREPAMSSAARRRSNARLPVNASRSSAGLSAKRPCHNGRASRALIRLSLLRGCLLAGNRLDAEAPEAHEPGGVFGPERGVGRVRRQLVVVQAVLRAAAGDEAATRLQSQPDLPRHRLLRRGDEGIERPAQRRVPEAVVHELGVPRLEPRLLPHDVAFEGDRLEIGVGEDDSQRTGTLVDLAALDPDPPVLCHVDATPAPGAHGRCHLLAPPRQRR